MDLSAGEVIMFLLGILQIIAFSWVSMVNKKTCEIEKSINEFKLQVANEYSSKVTLLFEKISHIDARIDVLLDRLNKEQG